MHFLPVNLNAILVELSTPEKTHALLDALQHEKIAGVVELIAGAITILIKFQPETITAAEIVKNITARNLTSRKSYDETLIKIPVHYNGDDLDEVATILGITTDEVIRRHTACDYTVAFNGFAPGFAYLTGGDASFNVPRRAVPRTRIPAGAVGLAGTFSGIYPQVSPGGWQIIGVTNVAMWQLDRAAPALLQPGFRVRFIDADKLTDGEEQYWLDKYAAKRTSTVCEIGRDNDKTAAPSVVSSLNVEFPGIQTVLQDLGRFGKAAQGVSVSGALDKLALKMANRLVGNPSDTACLENVYGRLTLNCSGSLVLAVTGAETPLTITTSEGEILNARLNEPIALLNGDKLTLGKPTRGVRTYLAVRGGFDIAPVLGSLSTDTLANLGPKPIKAGDKLPVKPIVHGNAVELAQRVDRVLPAANDIVTLDIVLGPRTDWFTPESIERLTSQLWQVTPESNRVGIRLKGEQILERANKAELLSEGTMPGAIQVPSGGQPILFLADHPLTGGYPVIGSVATYHLDLAGQIPVNARIRFNPVSEFNDLNCD